MGPVAVGRSGTTDPKVAKFRRLVALSTQRRLDFVNILRPPSELDSTRAAHRALTPQHRVAYAAPFSHALLRALELNGNRALQVHSSAWLADQLISWG